MRRPIVILAACCALPAAVLGAQVGMGPPARRPLEAQAVEIEEVPGVYEVVRSDPGARLLRWRGLEGEEVEIRLELATGIEAVVEAEVTGGSGEPLLYRYRLRSSDRSGQRVQALIVETLGPVHDVSAPDDWIVLPVSFHPAISWSDVSEQAGLAAGEELGGFSFRATTLERAERFTATPGGGEGFFHHRGVLPGIVQVWARGTTSTLTSPEELPPGMAANLPDMLENAVLGHTVGPVEISRDQTAQGWIRLLREYLRRSRELGWVTEPDLVEAIEADLGAIEDYAAGAQSDRALARLRDLLARLDTARLERSILPEAHALLTFNGEYLRTLLQRRLPALGVEEHKGDGS